MTPRTTLDSFLTAMIRWDHDWYARFDASDMAPAVVEQARAALTDIFARYVAVDADRRDDLIEAVAPAAPSQYADAVHQITTAVEEQCRAMVEVQLATGLKARFRYTLTRRDDAWRIVRREIWRGSSGQWAAHAI